jgi:hypothetical protein
MLKWFYKKKLQRELEAEQVELALALEAFSPASLQFSVRNKSLFV